MMKSPRQILSDYAIKPRKNLGQSFLIDQNIIRNISAMAEVSRQDIIVEIGSGIGVLTQYLAENAGRIIAVELDDKLVKVIEDRLKYKNLEIYHGNILKFDFRTIDAEGGIKVIGNIPYNISSRLMFYLLSMRKSINCFLLMMQREVAERLAANPGGKDYGVPSVILQMFAKVEKVMDVPASCFYPVPKVESSVIKGLFREKPLIELDDEDVFIKIVRDSFAQRRKTLINNLKKSTLLKSLAESFLKDILISSGIDPQRRGETLTVEEFGKLSNILSDTTKKDS